MLNPVHLKTRLAYNLAAQKYHELFHNEMNEKEFDQKLLDKFADKFNPGSLVCDAGCGPSAHIGRYLYNKGISVTGIDISDKCVELAANYNPGMHFVKGDIINMPFSEGVFDGIISYYSIIHTPKEFACSIFREFHRVLKKGGSLLVAVKAGTTEGFIQELLEIKTEVYFSLFTEEEIGSLFLEAGFIIKYLEKRNRYDFEINNDRIFAIGRKI